MILNQSFDQMPRRHNAFLKKIADFLFWASGWELQGTIANTPQLVVAVAPHRTAWEVVLGLMTICSLSLAPNWMGKHTIFRWPIGYLARWFGGIPIDRTKAHGVVSATIEQFEQNEQLFVVIMPEGTRAKAGVPVKEWKKGYYFIAYKAGVPVMPTYLDHANKQIIFGEAIEMDNDAQVVIDKLQTFYDNEKENSRIRTQSKS